MSRKLEVTPSRFTSKCKLRGRPSLDGLTRIQTVHVCRALFNEFGPFMLYLASAILFMIAAWRCLILILKQPGNWHALKPRDMLTINVAFIPAVLAVAPLLYALYCAYRLETYGLSGDASMTTSVYLLLVGGVLGVVFYGVRVLRGIQVRSGVLAVMAGLLLSFIAIDHLWFFRDGDQSGVVDATFLKYVGHPTDIDCNRVVLVSNIRGEAATYRCPNSVAIGGTFAFDPFVPWPSYTEGVSTKLGPAMSAIEANAKRGK